MCKLIGIVLNIRFIWQRNVTLPVFIFLSIFISIHSYAGLDSSSIVAYIEGKGITAGEICSKMQFISNGKISKCPDDEIVFQASLRKYLEIEILSKQALKENIAKDKDVIEKIEFINKINISSHYIKKKIYPKLNITDSEIMQYYNRYSNEFGRNEGVKLKHIFIKGIDDTAKQKAESIFNRLKTNLSFEDAAVQFSDDFSSKLNKGNIGYIEKNGSKKDFEDKLFAIKEKELSMFSTADGFHIVFIEDKIPQVSSNINDKSVRDLIVDKLKKKKSEEIINNIVKSHGATLNTELFAPMKGMQPPTKK